MKKVVFSPGSTTINFEEVDDTSKIGVQWQDGKRSMIIKARYGYIGISGDYACASWNEYSKKSYIERAVELGGDVYVFENCSELYKWVSEALRYS